MCILKKSRSFVKTCPASLTLCLQIKTRIPAAYPGLARKPLRRGMPSAGGPGGDRLYAYFLPLQRDRHICVRGRSHGVDELLCREFLRCSVFRDRICGREYSGLFGDGEGILLPARAYVCQLAAERLLFGVTLLKLGRKEGKPCRLRLENGQPVLFLADQAARRLPLRSGT